MKGIRQSLTEIMKLADDDAGGPLGSQMVNGVAHQIYVLARDALDIDTQNMFFYRGHYMSDETIRFMKSDRFINAIKQCRIETGLGLKEAKDLCEAYRAEHIFHTRGSQETC